MDGPTAEHHVCAICGANNLIFCRPGKIYQNTVMQDGGACVMGFEVPGSPEYSYINPIPGNEDESHEPPLAPPHLQHTLLSHPASQDGSCGIPSPQNVILNHLYIENRESPRSVVSLGITHRFRAKFVTVVLYKPILRR